MVQGLGKFSSKWISVLLGVVSLQSYSHKLSHGQRRCNEEVETGQIYYQVHRVEGPQPSSMGKFYGSTAIRFHLNDIRRLGYDCVEKAGFPFPLGLLQNLKFGYPIRIEMRSGKRRGCKARYAILTRLRTTLTGP